MAEGGSGLRPPANFFANITSQNPSDTSRSWSAWLEQYDFYMTATEKSSKSEEVQVATLLTLLGAQGQELYRTFALSDTDKKKIAPVKAAFTAYFSPRVKEEFERYKFYSRIQKPSESFDSFLTSLRDLLATCNFADAEKNKALRDRIVFGTNSEAVREELLNVDGNLDLDKCIRICQRHEATGHYLKELKPSETAHAVANSKPKALSSNNSQNSHSKQDNNSQSQSSSTQIKNCKYCGGSHNRGKCPAFGKECKQCGKKNHFAKVCKSGKPTNSNSKQKADEVIEFSPVDLAYEISDARDSRQWFINVQHASNTLTIKVDTGATCNVMPMDIFQTLENVKLTKAKKDEHVLSYSGHKIKILGKTSLCIEYLDKFTVHEFTVVESGHTSLLGFPSCVSMGLVQVANSISDNVVANEFSDVFAGVGCLPSHTKHVLRLKPDSKPVVQSPRRVPFRLRRLLKETLQTMEDSNHIQRVRDPTEWVNNTVLVVKPGGSLRICLDPTELNKCLKREHYVLPTASEIFSKLSDSRVFTTLDATSGFMQLELDEESSLLTTFTTPFGRYKFCRLPYGVKTASEVYHRTMVELFEDIEGVEIYIDDILIHAPTNEEHNKILKQVLQKCREVNLKLNLAKCRFEKTELKYLGHILGNGVIKPDPAKIQAIMGIPDPTCKEDLRRFLGMVTYLAKFCPNLSEKSAPLRELITQENWQWESKHDEAMTQIKSMISDEPVLRMFDPNLAVTLSVDSSQHGMGAVLLQEGQPVEFASCSLNKTQRAYAQIEKEFMAVQFGLQRFHQYVYGQKATVETDHLPLLGIMKKSLSDVTPRLMRMRLRMQPYDFDLIHKPGSKLVLADTLSRAFLNQYQDEADSNVKLDHDQIHAVTYDILQNLSTRQRLQAATKSDKALQILQTYITSEWPHTRNACIEPLKAYWNVRHDLSTHDDLILRNNQIVIPVAMRKQVMENIHLGHLGIVKCIERAKSTVYWPGYQNQIKDMVESCESCAANSRANVSEYIEPYAIPEYPMQTIHMDIFHLNGIEYLATIDRFSKWPTCYQLKNSTSREIINLLSKQFVDFGRPETCITDNATYFMSSDFKWFMQEHEIKHTTSSPLMSRSNGLAERLNQTIKSALQKSLDTGGNLNDVLTSLRSTPVGQGLPSPAVLLQGRNLRDKLNCATHMLKHQNLDMDKIRESMGKQQSESNFQANDKYPDSKFIEGMEVWVRMGHKQWKKAIIVEHANAPRSFIIELENGKQLRRNQSYLKVRRVPSDSKVQWDGMGVASRPVVINTENSNLNNTNSSQANSPEVSSGGSSVGSQPPSGKRTSTRESRPPQKFGYDRKFNPLN